jgi:predicted ferric reductase
MAAHRYPGHLPNLKLNQPQNQHTPFPSFLSFILLIAHHTVFLIGPWIGQRFLLTFAARLISYRPETNKPQALHN